MAVSREIVVRVSRATVIETLRQIVAGLGGKTELPERARVQRAIGLEALGIVKDAYVLKSRHGTDAAGEKWQPLSPVTIRRKGSDQILVDTGRLLASISPVEGSDPDGQVWKHAADAVEVGTNVEYVKYHRDGDGVPQRRPWPEIADWPDEWKTLLMHRLRDSIAIVLIERLIHGFEND